jgi:hypothetical protein
MQEMPVNREKACAIVTHQNFMLRPHLFKQGSALTARWTGRFHPMETPQPSDEEE